MYEVRSLCFVAVQHAHANPTPLRGRKIVRFLKSGFSLIVIPFYLVVFNIGGNKYRLITAIHFNRQKVYIRHVLTHEEYDRGAWKR